MKSSTIKSLLLLLAAVILSSASNGIEKKPVVPPGLELSCVLLHHDKRMSDYSVIIYRDDVVTDTILVDENLPIFFRLEYGHQYAIIHRAKGYRDRVVMVNTVVDYVASKRMTVFDYEIEMPEADEPENTLYDLPVAVVKYYPKAGKFDYSRKYQSQVRI